MQGFIRNRMILEILEFTQVYQDTVQKRRTRWTRIDFSTLVSKHAGIEQWLLSLGDWLTTTPPWGLGAGPNPPFPSETDFCEVRRFTLSFLSSSSDFREDNCSHGRHCIQYNTGRRETLAYKYKTSIALIVEVMQPHFHNLLPHFVYTVYKYSSFSSLLRNNTQRQVMTIGMFKFDTSQNCIPLEKGLSNATECIL